MSTTIRFHTKHRCKIEFYGNAGGGKVITVTAGKILALGQERIEVDCPIMGGNSGSPLILVSDGSVVGVTTLTLFNKVYAGDPSAEGTRYDTNITQTREFAVRFVGVSWQRHTYGSFLRQASVFKDLMQFGKMTGTLFLSANQYWLFEYVVEDLKFPNSPQLNELIRKIAKCDEAQRKVYDRIVMMREKNKENDDHSAFYGKTEFKNAYRSFSQKGKTAYRTRKEVLEKLLSYCKTTRALTDDEREVAVKKFDWVYRRYCDKYRMELKGIFPNPK